ncbi:nuclear transport factor 2 family protein [Georgenia daeguensis]|uniref:SnoaL-like domain-containing protein n=1 Tax=Georgenia daeguensis TaxID=908355 RepID=A0ABP8EY27_9MICO
MRHLPDPAALHAKLEIADVLARYCLHLDEYDIDALSDVFTPDCTMDQGPGRGGPILGRDEVLRGMKERQALFRRTQHILGQSLVVTSDDSATALTYVTAWHQRWDMSTGTARLRYRDDLVRTENGWRIHYRRSEALGVDGFDEAQWNWVPRRSADPELSNTTASHEGPR